MYEKAEDTCLEDVAAHLYALRKEPKAAVTWNDSTYLTPIKPKTLLR